MRGEFRALEERLSREVQRAKEQTDRLLDVVVVPLEAKLSAIEAKCSVLDFKVVEMSSHIERVSDDVARQSGGHGEEDLAGWQEAMQGTLEHRQDEAALQLRGEMVELVTQEVAARVQEQLAGVWQPDRGVSPASALGQSLMFGMAPGGRSPDAAYAAMRRSLVGVGDALQRGLEEAAEALREQLEAATSQSAHAFAEEATRAAVEALSPTVMDEVQRIAEELAVVKAGMRGGRGRDSGRSRSLGPEFACTEHPDSYAVRTSGGESRSGRQTFPQKQGERVTEETPAEIEQVKRRICTSSHDQGIEPVKGSLVSMQTQLKLVEDLSSQVEELHSTTAALKEVSACTRKDLDDLKEGVATQSAVQEMLEIVRAEMRQMATHEDLEGLRTTVSSSTAEMTDRIQALETLKELVPQKEALELAIAQVGELKSEVAELSKAPKELAQSPKLQEQGREPRSEPKRGCGDEAGDAPKLATSESRRLPEPMLDVVVMHPFKSDSEEGVDLQPGQSGFVSAVDEEGDALIFFDGMQKPQWVFSKHFGKVCFHERSVCTREAIRKDPPRMSMVELKETITRADLGVADCFSRAALVKKAEEAVALLDRAQRMERRSPLSLGLRLLYDSPTQKKWVHCKVISVNEREGSVRVDIKPGHWFSLEEQAKKFRPVEVSVGQAVLYRSLGASAWRETRVARVREDGAVEVAASPGRFFSLFEQLDVLRPTEDAHPELCPGDRVSVLEPFLTDSASPVSLRVGQVGLIMELDEDGDALVDFDGEDLAQWVIGTNFEKLKVWRAAADVGAETGSEAPGADEEESSDNQSEAQNDPSSSSANAYAEGSKGTSVKRRGSIVLVQEDFMSDSRDSVPLKTNIVGIISDVDSEGDVLVSFPGQRGEQWVAGDNMSKLAVLGHSAPPGSGGLAKISEAEDGSQTSSAGASAGAGEAQPLQKGQTVIVKDALLTDSLQPVRLKALDQGRVHSVDAEGNAVIDFDDGGRQKVNRGKMQRLIVLKNVVAPSASSESDASCPEGEGQRWRRGAEARLRVAGRWRDCVMEEVRRDGAVTVDAQPGVWITKAEQEAKLRGRGEAIFREGEMVQYKSLSFDRWLDGRVVDVASDGGVMLDVKRGHWFNIQEQLSKIRPMPLVEGQLVEAMCEMMSDSQTSNCIKRGSRGVVLEVDDEGDTLVRFDGQEKQEWVFKNKAENLRVVGSKPTSTSSRVVSADVGAGVRMEAGGGADVKVHMRLRATGEFKTDMRNPMVVAVGDAGEVMNIDPDGNALVRFDGHGVGQWVSKRNLAKMEAVSE